MNALSGIPQGYVWIVKSDGSALQIEGLQLVGRRKVSERRDGDLGDDGEGVMQLQMFDPRITPTATAEMLADGEWNDAINSMRCGVVRPWPYVERLCKVVWAVDDEGERYVVVRGLVWTIPDLVLAEGKIRNLALKAFARLDVCWGAA